ncbi:N(2),N(2)-dimethylguanosine tRNA methyltransferase [Aureococcus anophagefferens]|nr:N(2),N(2)-dimethylguanosine tRNA methyltransferase [Aureococcus anophagefferens]
MAAATDAPSKKRDASAMDAGYQRITEGSASMNYELRGADTRNRGTADHDGPGATSKRGAQARRRGKAATARAAAERERLYALSAADLDALLRAEAQTDGIRVLDALAATGLRSIRYAKEVPGVRKVVANDVDADAAAACGRNAAENGAADICEAHCGDAVDFMTARGKGSQGRRHRLDPYGSCAPFLDAAVQAVNDGGLLCVTSTDMTVLSGNYPEVCFATYGSMPTKAKHLHEFALRILVHAIEAAAAKYQRHVVPVLSLSIDFYVRVFVRVYKRPAEVKKSAAKRAFDASERQSARGARGGAAAAFVRRRQEERRPRRRRPRPPRSSAR